MNVHEAIEDLEGFNEILQELATFRLAEWREKPYTVNLNRDLVTDRFAITGTYPDDETVEAVTGKFRLFGQDNDRFSIGKIAALYRCLEQRHLLPPHLPVTFEVARTSLHNLLNRNTMLSAHGHLLKRWQIMEIVTYGAHVHRDRSKARVYNHWSSQEAFILVKFVFIDTVMNSLHLFDEMAVVNTAALACLQGKPNVQFIPGNSRHGRPDHKLTTAFLDDLLKHPLEMFAPGKKMILRSYTLDGRPQYSVDASEADYQAGVPIGPPVFK